MTPIVSPLRLAFIVAASLALSLFAFSPRLWLMQAPMPGTYQWDRGTTFLQQCENPFRHDIEPAMQWRLLPPLVAHGLGLSGRTPFVLPWIGVITLTGYVAVLFRRRLADARWVAGGTLLFTTTSAVLVPFHWFGVNDAWVWLGLLAVSFGRARWALPLACLLCPWVDERFIIGFSLAWLVARIDRQESWCSPRLMDGLWLLPYAVLRLAISHIHPDMATTSVQFVTTSLRTSVVWWPMAPLAWWMGLRAAWLPIVFAITKTPPGYRAIGAITLVLTLLINAVLAADLSRSVSVLCPVILLGCWHYARESPAIAPRHMLIVGLASLLLPAVHVVGVKIDPINPLPIEIMRLVRSPA